ncbi:spore germination protein [Lachnospiraceae bacterium NSJ-143]|nr:spore germination protein [Lachnospiraceae bacterium NSJ-143]
MNFSCNDRISNNQLRAILVAGLLGNLAVSAPLGVIEKSGSAAYISIAIGGLAAAVLFYILIKLTSAGFVKSYEDMSTESLGRGISFVLFAVVLIHIVLYGGFQLSISARMVQETMEKGVGKNFASLIIVLVSAYMAQRGSECIGRIAEIAAVLMLIFIAFIFIVSAPSMDLTVLRTTPAESRGILKGAFDAFCSMSAAGFVFMLSPKTNNTKKSAMSVFSAIIIVTAVLSFGTALSVSCFGLKEAERKLWPVIQMMNYTEFPGSLVERQEVLMSGFYVFSSFILTGISVYLSSSLLGHMFKSVKKKWPFLLASCLAVYALQYCGKDAYGDFNLIYWLYRFNPVMYIIMIISPVAAIVRRKK